MIKELWRKFFHLFGLIYVAGVIFLPRSVFLWSVLAFVVVEGLFEILRLKNKDMNQKVKALFGDIVREHEQTQLSGVFWMALGALVSAFIVGQPMIAATGLLYLVFGDTAASLGGKFLKGPHWPGSQKRWSGSVSCFVVCLGIGVVFVGPGWTAVVGALVATLLEMFPLGFNDNFIIPVGSTAALMFCYGLVPPFV